MDERLTPTVMFLVVVLFFSVACSAFPTYEDGAQCLTRCFFEANVRNASEEAADSMSVAEHNRAHSVFKRDIFSSASGLCEVLRSSTILFHEMSDHARQCEEREPEGDEALCKNVASCLLGSGLNEVKADYPKDVVTIVTDVTKLSLTFSLRNPKTPPAACSILYEPYDA